MTGISLFDVEGLTIRNNIMKSRIRELFIGLAVLASVHQAAAQGTTAFTYQGQLRDNGTNANGTYTMVFALYDSLSGGNQVGTSIITTNTLANGLFTVNLDFGAGAFDGSARYLDVTVQGGSDSEELTPRVQVLPSPYALYAAVAATVTNGAIMSTQLASDSNSLAQVTGGSAYVQNNGMVSFSGGGVALSENFGGDVPPSTWSITSGYSYDENEDGFDPGYFVNLLSFVGSSGDVPLQIIDEPGTGWAGISVPNVYADTIYATDVVAAGTFYGDGSGLTNLSVSPIPCMQVFDTPGTYQFTVPQNVTKIMVEVWGGGGGGGSGQDNGPSDSGPGDGGGAGGYGKGVFTVIPGNSYTVIVGSGGGSDSQGSASGFGACISASGGNAGEYSNPNTVREAAREAAAMPL
jgi:hypothetical protein